ncbi:MAG: four helix bundle protein [Flavobacteriales bacterium]|nr:four helix bundle protein [Flavobacteriales bacterium]
MHNYKELIIWKESMRLAKEAYLVSAAFPQDERFGLTSQVRRCAVSIPSNIAEGAGRKSDKEFLHFLSLASGSIYELETQLLLCIDLGYSQSIKLDDCFMLITALQKMLYKFQEQLSIKTSSAKV